MPSGLADVVSKQSLLESVGAWVGAPQRRGMPRRSVVRRHGGDDPRREPSSEREEIPSLRNALVR